MFFDIVADVHRALDNCGYAACPESDNAADVTSLRLSVKT